MITPTVDATVITNVTTKEDLETNAGEFWTSLNSICGDNGCTEGATTIKDDAVATMTGGHTEDAEVAALQTLYTTACNTMVTKLKEHFR